MLNNSFYYGEFEFPEGSGKVYQGSHKPLTTKAVFDQIQQSRSIPNKADWGSKHFAFKEIFKCATCGACITAEEKFKQRVDGGFNRHVYYRCTRQVNPDCTERAITEKDLIHGLTNYIAEHYEEIKVTDEIARTAVRHSEIVEKSLQKRGMDTDEIEPLTEYSEFILSHGSYSEKTKLIEGIQTTFAIKDKSIIALNQAK